MVKITRTLAERLLCLLGYMHHYGDVSTENAITKGYSPARDMIADAGHKPNHVLRNAHGYGIDTKSATHSDLFRELTAALTDYEVEAASIVAQMVEILSSPNNLNMMVGENVRMLRRAVLLPSEMSKVHESLRKEMRCAHCGHVFIQGQMAAVSDQGDGITFYCSNCYAPTSAACRDGCETVVPIDQNMLLDTILKKCLCPKHGGKKVKEVLVTEADIQEVQRRAERNARAVDPGMIAPQVAPGRGGRLWGEARPMIRLDEMAPIIPPRAPDPLFPDAVGGGGVIMDEVAVEEFEADFDEGHN